MQTKSIAIATVLAAALSGNAFAAGEFQPASGEGPLFLNNTVASASVSRQAVREQAVQATQAALTPRRHALDVGTLMAGPSLPVTRAEMRAQTRNAISHGARVASGEMS